MLKITGSPHAHPLHGVAATRAIEAALAHRLPPHTLMARAAAASVRLAQAIAPHARSIWVACGPGNNGGDGLLTAALLAPWIASKGGTLTVTWCGNNARMPADARWAMSLARQAGVCFADNPPPDCDLTIDALLGIGQRTHAHADGTTPAGGTLPPLQHFLGTFRHVGQLLLCLDTPSDLDADAGLSSIANYSIPSSGRSVFTITFLTIKPGLFTGHGRDAAGEVWFDDLGAGDMALPLPPAAATLAPAPGVHGGPTSAQSSTTRPAAASGDARRHATHKGDFGDVWVVGGQGMSHNGHAMTGAALLAGRAALHAGAGRVFVVPLDDVNPISLDAQCPELMFRGVDVLQSDALSKGVWVCGCGGGEAIVPHLPALLRQVPVLVLDADALNAVAAEHALRQQLRLRANNRWMTVLTPHPLEAARLLGTTATQVQLDRLAAAVALAEQMQCICVLKGSGTVIASPGRVSMINPTGNGKLSTAGTGDVLAGMLGAAWARCESGAALGKSDTDSTLDPAHAAQLALAKQASYFDAVCDAVWQHGHLADAWPPGERLSASELARAAAGGEFIGH